MIAFVPDGLLASTRAAQVCNAAAATTPCESKVQVKLKLFCHISFSCSCCNSMLFLSDEVVSLFGTVHGLRQQSMGHGVCRCSRLVLPDRQLLPVSSVETQLLRVRSSSSSKHSLQCVCIGVKSVYST